MKHVLSVIGLIGVALVSARASADDTDAAIQAKAAAQTQHMMTTPSERAKVVNADPGAKRVDETVKQAVGGTNVEDTYALAADVFNQMVKDSGGDSIKMMELLQQAQKDPAAFAAKWTPQQKAKLKAIGDRAPAANGQDAAPK